MRKPQKNDRVVLRKRSLVARTTQKEPREVHVPSGMLGFFLVVIVGIGIWYGYNQSEFFNIKDIKVSGKVTSEAQQVIDRTKGKNILFLKTDQLERDIKTAFPEAMKITITRGLPDVLQIKIKTRKTAFIWVANGKKYFMDSSGIVFAEAGLEDLGKYTVLEDIKGLPVELGDKVVTTRLMLFVKAMVTKIKDDPIIEVSDWEIGDTSLHVNAHTNKGWMIYFDTSRNPDYQFEDMKRILNKHSKDIKEYLDLRVPGFAYYK